MNKKLQDTFVNIGKGIPKKATTPQKLCKQGLCEEISNIQTNMHKTKKAPKKHFSKKEIEYQQGIGVFMAFFCSSFAFFPFGAIVVDFIFGKFLSIFPMLIISFAICFLFFNYIFQKLAKKGKLEGWKPTSGPMPNRSSWLFDDSNHDLAHSGRLTNINHRRS